MMIPLTKTGNTGGRADLEELHSVLNMSGWKDLRGFYVEMTSRILDRYHCGGLTYKFEALKRHGCLERECTVRRGV